MTKESDKYGTTEIQKSLLSMLKDFNRFCKQQKIRYSLSSGTLLGAIRHNGFIPWDDDADIMVDRKISLIYWNQLINLRDTQCIGDCGYTGFREKLSMERMNLFRLSMFL